MAAMEARFPNLGMGVALDIGSKVARGEMKWGCDEARIRVDPPSSATRQTSSMSAG